MKSKLPLLLSLLPLTALAGCSNNFSGKVNLLYGALFDDGARGNEVFHLNEYVEDGEFKQSNYLRYPDLQSLVDGKESFILAIRAESETCACYTGWRDSVLRPYMQETNVEIYLIAADTLNVALSDGRTRAESLGFSSLSENTLALFSEGTLAYSEVAPLGSQMAEDLAYFKDWMSKRVELPRMLYVNDAQLDALYEGNEDFLIYYGRSTCADCTYMREAFLDQYLAENKDMDITYVIDCDQEGIRYKNGELDSMQWDAYKESHGLAESEANPAGFDSGYVPTIIYVSPNNGQKTGDIIKGYDVFLNDSYDENYIISATYFSKERVNASPSYLEYLTQSELETKVLEGVDLGEYEGEDSAALKQSWYREKASVYHSEISKAFFDYYVK